MAETTFEVNNQNVIRFRLEPTDIFGAGSHVSPILRLMFKMQLLSVPTQPQGDYTLLRLSGSLSYARSGEEISTFESDSLAEKSSPQSFDRHMQIDVWLTPREIAWIEDSRGGKDPQIRIRLSGLVFLHGQGFHKLTDKTLDLSVPRSHWLDHVLTRWNFSDLRLMEISLPSTPDHAFSTVIERLNKAEQLYRVGDYSHVLSSLRAAFEAFAAVYGAERADKNLFDKLLTDLHQETRERLRDAFDYTYRMLNLGPHEPVASACATPAIGRHEARFALISSHAVFEYFSRRGLSAI